MKRRYIFIPFIPHIRSAAIGQHAIAITKFGTAWSWGNNSKGQLGINSTGSTFMCTPVAVLGTLKTFCKIMTIGSVTKHSFAIDYKGMAWGWGYNFHGPLGDNTAANGSNKWTPRSVLGATKTLCKICGGYDSTITLDYKGKSWNWGYNLNGMLGDNTTTSRLTPVSIQGANKTFCSIAHSYNHVAAIDNRGLVWCWGGNNVGQLGTASLTSRNTPITISGSWSGATKKTFCHISAGYYFTAGIDYKGGVWCWGSNNYGQLGINTTALSKTTPINISGVAKTFCEIVCGQSHVLAIDKYGQGWCWGWNAYGQLGINSAVITSVLSPIRVLGIVKTFCQISAGAQSSLCLNNNTILWGWGYNNYGQLGDNSSINALTPISIYHNSLKD